MNKFNKDNEMNEKAYRSIVKTISWRVLGTVDTIIISYIITDNLKMATSIGSIELVTKMILYYYHERAWNKINLGRGRIHKNDLLYRRKNAKIY